MADAGSCSSTDSREFEIVHRSPKLRVPYSANMSDIKEQIADASYDDAQVTYNGIVYLGSATLTKPSSELEVNRNMSILNANLEMAIPIILSLPRSPDGLVRVYEVPRLDRFADTNEDPILDDEADGCKTPTPSKEDASPLTHSVSTEIANFSIFRIVFCARGPPASEYSRCIAFSYATSSDPTSLYQCHVFRCANEDAVPKIMFDFTSCFNRTARRGSLQSAIPSLPSVDLSLPAETVYQFVISVDIKEEESRGRYTGVPRDKDAFKIRRDVEKQICVGVQQVQSSPSSLHPTATQASLVRVDRCFGLLLAPGRCVKHADMRLIDLDSMGWSNDGSCYNVSGVWRPFDAGFDILNMETSKDLRVFMTIAVDLVMRGIREPVRFYVETKVRIFSPSSTFWQLTARKPHQEHFYLRLRRADNSEDEPATATSPAASPSATSASATTSAPRYDLISCMSQTHMLRQRQASLASVENNDDDESDNDDALLSGTGQVSREIAEGDEDLVRAWHVVLQRWHARLDERPKQVLALVRRGVPDALRGELWQLLAGTASGTDYIETYRLLLPKDCDCEQMILRDVSRTFPAHERFRQPVSAGGGGGSPVVSGSGGSDGQEALFRICRAYAIHDAELGYTQGMSFLAATLLLHMPEEQAFAVLVRIMFDYGLRSLFLQHFDGLHLRLHQLGRLIQSHLSELSEHFIELGIEPHMFASQWLLTVFTAKFPLTLVYRVLDLVLSEGLDLMLTLSVALLKDARADLLALDFEGCLKYFRVNMPKRFRTEESSERLVQAALNSKLSRRKLDKLSREYETLKEQRDNQVDPLDRYVRENGELAQTIIRLELENDELAAEMLALRDSADAHCAQAQRRVEQLSHELAELTNSFTEISESRRRLDMEYRQLQETHTSLSKRADEATTSNAIIIADYRRITTRLGTRLERSRLEGRARSDAMRAQIESCESCKATYSDPPTAPTNSTSTDNTTEQPGGDCPASNGAYDDDDGNDEIDLTDSPVDKDAHIRSLELELARTKLALVESECHGQELLHQLQEAAAQSKSSGWLAKTFGQLTVRRESLQHRPNFSDA